jgi:hypothetical protein
LHNQHQRAETAISPWARLREQGEWKYQRSKDNKQQTQAIDANQILGTD